MLVTKLKAQKYQFLKWDLPADKKCTPHARYHQSPKHKGSWHKFHDNWPLIQTSAPHLQPPLNYIWMQRHVKVCLLLFFEGWVYIPVLEVGWRSIWVRPCWCSFGRAPLPVGCWSWWWCCNNWAICGQWRQWCYIYYTQRRYEKSCLSK